MIQLSERHWVTGWSTGPRKHPIKSISYTPTVPAVYMDQFNRRVDNMAKGLLAIGITHGTHVGIWRETYPTG